MLDPCFNHTKIYFLTFLRNFMCAKNNACDTEQISKKNLKEKEKLLYFIMGISVSLTIHRAEFNFTFLDTSTSIFN